jgi:hypothetical protein
MVVALCGLQEVVQLLERDDDLVEFLKKKVRAAVIDKIPIIVYTPKQLMLLLGLFCSLHAISAMPVLYSSQ